MLISLLRLRQPKSSHPAYYFVFLKYFSYNLSRLFLGKSLLFAGTLSAAIKKPNVPYESLRRQRQLGKAAAAELNKQQSN